MRKLLLVIPSAAHSGAATQLRLVASALPREDFEIRVGVLGGEGPLTRSLRRAGVTVEALGWTRLVDLHWLRRLRDLVNSFRPDIIHAYRLTAVRALFLAGRNSARLVASAPVPNRERGIRLSQLDRWLLGKVDRIVAGGPAEAARYRQLGLPGSRTVVIPPAAPATEPVQAGDRFAELGARVPAGARVVLAVGPLARSKGFQDALWAMGILRFLPVDPHLVLAGTGPDQALLEEFAQRSEVASRVHFLGERAEIGPLLDQAEVVWVPSRAGCGRSVALEAMAAGRPVLASRLPELAEIVADGTTGFLVPPGDKVALARQTSVLLADPELARRLGEAGRQRAASHFAVPDLARGLQALYEGNGQARLATA